MFKRGGKNAPGNSNSLIRLPLLKSCSSSFASLNLPQYLWCSASAAQCSPEQCVGHPQSGHSNWTVLRVAWGCPCAQLSAHTGQGASFCIAALRSRTAWNGDLENGWKRSSCDRTGFFCAFALAFACSDDFLLKRERKVRVCWLRALLHFLERRCRGRETLD